MIRNFRSHRRWSGTKASPLPSASFDLTANNATIPTGWTYTRADTTATRRDSSGIMQRGVSNTARFDYDVNGVALGMRVEATRVNRFSNFNILPTAVADFSVTGTATIGLSADATPLTTAKLNTLVTANVFEASGGASGGTVVLPGTTGSTSACSFSTWARITAGTSCTLTHNGTSPGSTTISGAAYARFTLENQTISATTVQMVLNIPASTTVRFILCQNEVGVHTSSEIITAGAAATRANENFGDLSLLTRNYFDINKGAIIMETSFDDVITTPIARLFGLTDTSNGVANCMGLYRLAAATRHKVIPQFVVASATQYSADVGTYDVKLQRWAAAISWVNNVQGAVATGADSYAIFPTPVDFAGSGINRVYFGCRAGIEQLNGHIISIKFYKNYRTPQQLGRDMVRVNDRTVIFGGQSNGTNLFSSQTSSKNAGEVAMKAVTDLLWTANRGFYVNGGTVATTVKYYSATSNDANYWINTDTGALGAPFRRWMEMAAGCRNATLKAIIDVSGESDAGQCTKQEYKDAQIAKFNLQRGIVGAVPVILVNIGRNSGPVAYQTIREASWELAAENPTWIFLAPERFDLALVDGLHITDGATGTTPLGDRIARKMHKILGDAVVGGVDGPAVGTPSRSGVTVTVPLAHDGGTDFTPTTAIAGFHYFNGADYQAAENVSTWVRTNANTITGTLTSSSAGTLYYGLAGMDTDTIANLVKDNSTQALPLKSGKWTVA